MNSMKTMYPKHDPKILHNPGKGYVLYNPFGGKVPAQYEKYAPWYGACLETATCLNLKIGWLALQPDAEDQFNWKPVDDVLALAEKLGKRVMFGFGGVVSTGGVQEGIRSLVPQWVYDAGAKFHDIECPNYKMGGTNINRIPDWECPIYREKNEKFIAAVAARYDGHPLIDAFINFCHGNWGEWHHFDINYLPLGKQNLYIDFKGRQLDLDFFRYYVDLFPRFFKKTPLMLPTNTHDEEDELEPWVKYGVDTYHMGIKREGLITIPECTYSMEYCAGKGPAFGEWQTAYAQYMADGRWNDELVDKEIIRGKLTHYNMGYYNTGAWQYIQEKPEQVAYWANHMGYYYSVKACTYAGDTARITLANDGVAPTYLHPVCELCAIRDGKVLACWQAAEIDLRTVTEKSEKTFDVALPKWDDETVLGIRFMTEYGELQLANVKDPCGYYLLQSSDVLVHFDHRPRENARLTGKYLGVDFGDQAWYTHLRREKYITCLYPDVYLNDYDMTFTLPEGKRLKSITAFGYGNLTLTDEKGQTLTAQLARNEQTYDTHFTAPSGQITLHYDSPYACWSIQITALVYGD